MKRKIENYQDKSDRYIAMEILDVMIEDKRKKLQDETGLTKEKVKILNMEIGILQAAKINMINYLFILK